jgi:hypothetical protein
MRANLLSKELAKDWSDAAISASNLSEMELSVGDVVNAQAMGEQSVTYADRSDDEFHMVTKRTTHAAALHAAGRRKEAERLFADAERRQKKRQPTYSLLYSLQGYRYCDLQLARGEWVVARDRARRTLELCRPHYRPLGIALDTLTLGRAHLGVALENIAAPRAASTVRDDAHAAQTQLDEAIDGLRAAGQLDYAACGLLARAAFRRSIGHWDAAARDLEEVAEIAEPGPMRLHLCDMALERARLALARIEAFAPLNGLVDDGPPKPVAPDAAAAAHLADEARANLAAARKLITDCSYHRRDEELAELEDVRDGKRRFADLPPRV